MSTTWFPKPPCRNLGHGMATDADAMEAKLVSQLVLFLDRGPRSLTEISSMAPHGARHYVREVGGVLNWLRKYSELFAISGRPGGEVVALKVARKSSSHSEPTPSQWKDDRTDDFAGVHDHCGKTPGNDFESALLLRGLPYQATKNDIKQFLGRFAKSLKGDQPIQVMSKKRRKPSGFAKVQLDSPESAADACECLHKRLMLDRYVEVFPFDQKYKDIATVFAVVRAAADDVTSQGDQQARSAAVQECRDYLELVKRNQVFLSVLGGALSDASRLYLKRTAQTLKQLLGEHPEEFKFSGLQQQQTVRHVSMLTPSEVQSPDCKAGNATTYSDNSCTRPNNSRSRIIELHRHLTSSNVEARSALSERPPSTNFDDIHPPSPPPPGTPELPPQNFAQPVQSPSDWGTQHPNEMQRDAQQSFNEVNWSATISSCVSIHGLPLYIAEQDVLALLSAQGVVQHVMDMPNPVVFLEQTTDVPVKSALVNLKSSAAIHVLQQALQGMQVDLHTISVSGLLSSTKYPEHVFGMACTSSAPSLATHSWGGCSLEELFDFLVCANSTMDDTIHEPIDTSKSCDKFWSL